MKEKAAFLKCLLFLLMLTPLLGACNGKPHTVAEGNGSQSEQADADNGYRTTPDAPGSKNEKGDPVEIVFYTNNGDSEASFDYRYGDLIRQKFPDYSIKYITRTQGTNLDELLANKTRFDIFFQSIGNFEEWAFPYGIEYDMSELINKHQVDLKRFEPTIIEAMRQASGGKLFGLPVQTNNLVLYYNKDIFDKFGVEYPKDGMMWEEMVKLSLRLSRNDGNRQYLGYVHSPSHTIRMNPMSIPGVDAKTDKPTIYKDERWKTFYETYFKSPTTESGYTNLLTQTGAVPNNNNAFVKDQNAAMMMYLSSLIYVWEEQLKAVNWDIVSLPAVKPGIGSQSYPSYFGITKMAKHKDAAMEVLKFMVSDEFQSSLARKGIMPVLNKEQIKREFGKDSPYRDRNMKAVFYNDFAPIPERTPYDAKIVNTYSSFFTQTNVGKLDINSALLQAEEQANIAIEDYKKNQ